MAIHHSLGQKGQVSLEFILILVVSIVYLNSVVFPQVDFGEATLTEMQGMSQAAMAGQKIANTLNSLSVQTPNARQTITVLVPKNATISCANTKFVIVSFQLNSDAVACDIAHDGDPANNCAKKIPTRVNCPDTFSVTGPQEKQLIIANAAGTISIT